MIFIACALYAEAKPLIKYYDLKPSENGRFSILENHDLGIVLCVTGCGRVNAAVSVSHMLTMYNACSSDFLCNIGTCAGNYPVGKLFIINRITEFAAKRTYYPDLLYRHDFEEAEAITVDVPINSDNPANAPSGLNADGSSDFKDSLGITANPMVYDMESSGIYQCGIKYLGCENISFIKIVSDNLNAASVTAESLEKCLSSCLLQIDAYIRNLQSVYADTLLKRKNVFPECCDTLSGRADSLYKCRTGLSCEGSGSYDEITSFLSENLKCSVTMESQLKHLLKYMMLSDADIDGFVNELTDKFQLPCKTREEGKIVLEYIRNSIL